MIFRGTGGSAFITSRDIDLSDGTPVGNDVTSMMRRFVESHKRGRVDITGEVCVQWWGDSERSVRTQPRRGCETV